MRYKFTYRETHCGSEYGEYEFVTNGGYGFRLLASFGQRWREEGQSYYGGIGYFGNW